MAKKSSTLSRKVQFKFGHVLFFGVAFVMLGVLAVLQTMAAPVNSLPQCNISPSGLKVGDYSFNVTAPLGPIPVEAIEKNYRVKLQTPYNTATADAVYDPATGTATMTWNGGLVKGKYAFYFIYYTGYSSNNQVVRASQTCSVNIR